MHIQVTCHFILLNSKCQSLHNTEAEVMVKKAELEALRERRPPWLRQITTPILPTVKMLSLGGERLPRPPPPPPIEKSLDLHHYCGVFLAHLLILEYPDYHQNLISSSLYYPGPLHKISPQSVHSFLSNVVHRQADRQTDKPTLPKT